MSLIKSNEKNYQVYLNKNLIEHLKKNEDCDIIEFINKFKQENNFLSLICSDVLSLHKLSIHYAFYLFGGVVRSFLLRKEDTQDINIWFDNKPYMDNFIKDIKEKWSAIKCDKIINDENYPYKKEKYTITSPKTGFKYIVDITLSTKLPVDDYDVNSLIFNGLYFSLHKSLLSYQSILSNIEKKEMYKLKTFKIQIII